MPKEIEGHLVAKKGARFALVVARFNSLVTGRLRDGALDCLVRHGVSGANIDVYRVPGSFELSLALKRVCAKKRYAAAVALGCVIRGQTPHFDYVAGEAVRGIGRVALESGVPVGFGLLTCDSLEQALERAGAKSGNKGWEAALSALEMADLLGKIG